LLTYQSPECHKDVFTSPLTLVNDPTIPKPVKEKTLEEVEGIGGRVGALESEKHESTDNSLPTRVIQEADDISLFTRIIQEIQEVVQQEPDLHKVYASQTERDVTNAFKSFAARERRISENARLTKAKNDREAKLGDLKKFADSFKFHTPVPSDLRSIILKGPAKRKESQDKHL
jgi:hypothetical protein